MARATLPTTRYRDRTTGEICDELVYGEAGLHFLYNHPFGKLATHLVLKRQWFSQLAGWRQRNLARRAQIDDFIRRLGIDPSEAELPLDAYRTLDDFFTRRLKPEARPVDHDPRHLISPAEGRVLAYAQCSGEGLRIKNTLLSLTELLDDPRLAEQYHGGGVLIVRLAPADYHRFHFPDGGTASAPWRLGRGLHSVHAIALEAGTPIFRNRRVLTRLDSDHFGSLLLIDVGAMIVGTIMETFMPGRVERGDEKGYFRFGGSTVVMLAEPGRVVWDEDLLADSASGMETLVRYGTRIGRTST